MRFQLFLARFLIAHLEVFHTLLYELHQQIYVPQKILILLLSLLHKIFLSLEFLFLLFQEFVFHKYIKMLNLLHKIFLLDKKIINHIFCKPIKLDIFDFFFICTKRFSKIFPKFWMIAIFVFLILQIF